MYSVFRSVAERWLRIPSEPEPPPGDEETARVFRASPNYLRYLKVLWGFGALVGLIGPLFALIVIAGLIASAKGADDKGAMFGILAGVGLLVVVFVIAQALVSLALVQLNYEKRWYLVTNRSLRIREGVTTVKEITFTFANIQNLSVTQGPIQRMLGIADLKVETAGGGGAVAKQGQPPGANLHTAFFRGIDNAEEVKQLIAERMRAHRDSGLGDQDDRAGATEVEPAPDALDALREVLDEARRLRLAAGRGR